MIKLLPDQKDLKQVLCLGAHCDDIEIGCGGTLVALSARYPDVLFHWIVFSGNTVREAETRAAAARLHSGAAQPKVEVHHFSDSYFPDSYGEIKTLFNEMGRTLSPDLIFTHRLEDRHQDHRTIAELTWNTFRNHLVLEYEIPKYEGDLGQPNLFVPLTGAQGKDKVSALMDSFPSQRNKPWFTSAVFEGLLSLRGMECRSPSGLAEGFYARKLSL